MKYIVVLLLVVVAFVAGYLTPKSSSAINAEKISDIFVQNANKNSTDEMVYEKEVISDSAQINATQKLAKAGAMGEIVADDRIKTNDHANPSIPPATARITPAPTLEVSDIPLADGGINEAITDAEIDKLVPAPFNKYLKGNHGRMRDRYRKFVDQEQPSDPDRDLYNRLSDSIFSNPYAKYLNIDAMQCRAGLCEIRLYERKAGVWRYIQAEMSLQDWWKFNNSSAHGFDTEDKNLQGWYVLLTN